jgi:hypothetical protein
MKTMETTMSRLTATLGLALALASAALAIAQPQPPPAAPAPQAGDQPPSIPERVAALKKSLAESKARLKDYEWIETTVVSLKGEEKSSTQKRCYHGADGKLQKITIETSPEPEKKPGIRGRIIEKKKEELTDYMKQAVELVHRYVPPEPEAIQKAKEAGDVSIAILEPGKRIRLEFKDFLMPGDELRTEVTLADDHLAAIGVSTFLFEENHDNDKKDPVKLEVRMGSLEDGTTYAEESTLEAKAKHLKVVVTNSGYRKIEK